MSAFSDLLQGIAAQNPPQGCLGAFAEKAVVGASFLVPSSVFLDSDGAPIDFSTGITATCRIVDASGGVIASPTFTGFNDGTFTLSLDESVTAAITPGRYAWGCLLSDGTDVVPFWVPSSSPFMFLAAA
ncbi:hypothetical protein [Nocardioides terrisoli]|uniref:hypothetical protein n=1 Tax=Nocardioides terrisoli TaxID=3388267 RepID=UPI00287BC151|nr:hypothetical protein [Nocardioides marmorisolisilvae]